MTGPKSRLMVSLFLVVLASPLTSAAQNSLLEKNRQVQAEQKAEYDRQIEEQRRNAAQRGESPSYLELRRRVAEQRGQQQRQLSEQQRQQRQQATPQNQAPIQRHQNQAPVEPPKNQAPIHVLSPKEMDEYNAAWAERKAQKERMDAEAAAAKAAKIGTKDEAKRHTAEIREARKADDAEAKTAALADGVRGRKHKVDMDICGVPLGKVLDFPDCGAVGRLEEVGSTCLSHSDDGASSVHFAKGACPAWTTTKMNIYARIPGGDDITTQMKGDVLVAVTIAFQATNPEALGALSAVESSQKQLRAKYGKPTKSDTITVTNAFGATVRTTPSLEWRLPGLHVRYEVSTDRDSISIELDSVAKAQAEEEKAKEAAAPKL